MFYEVINRTITKPISVEEVHAAGLKKKAEINIMNSHATTYGERNSYAEPKAVFVFEREGFNYIGERV